jgi:hypothetical protein
VLQRTSWEVGETGKAALSLKSCKGQVAWYRSKLKQGHFFVAVWAGSSTSDVKRTERIRTPALPLCHSVMPHPRPCALFMPDEPLSRVQAAADRSNQILSTAEVLAFFAQADCAFGYVRAGRGFDFRCLLKQGEYLGS